MITYLHAVGDGSTVMVLPPRCSECNRQEAVEIPGDVWYKYGVQGLHVQDAWPSSTPDQREMLLTGTHPECWDRMWGVLK